MQRILNNMATMDHPWACPHGRPTMRHLIDLDALTSSAQAYGAYA
jgi:DNA mismatch repair protein PMS2